MPKHAGAGPGEGISWVALIALGLALVGDGLSALRELWIALWRPQLTQRHSRQLDSEKRAPPCGQQP